MALLASDSFMVRTLQNQFNCLLFASLSLMFSVETENRSEQRVQFALFLLEASEAFLCFSLGTRYSSQLSPSG